MQILILKCYKILFSENGIIKNIGFFITIAIIIFHFIFTLLFYKRNLKIIKNMIKDIFFGIMNWKLIKKNRRVKIWKFKKENKEKLCKRKIHVNKIPNKIKIRSKNKYINPPKKNKNKNKNIVINNYLNFAHNNKYDIKNKKIIFNSKKKLSPNKSILQKVRKIMAYNDEELNQLSYELALKYDNRTYCKYYISLIKTKHNLIFSFLYNKDYNLRIIKIDLFFINFVLEFTLNALFFNDDTMHKIYEDKGKFDFLYQLPQIIYSLIISSVLDACLKLLALTEEYILNFKHNTIILNLNKRYARLFKKMKFILLLFCIISTIFLLLFWYYISIFCAIYKNTQFHLIKDTLISFSISFLYPFIIYLLPGFFRIPSLSNRRNKKKCLYNISKFFQVF